MEKAREIYGSIGYFEFTAFPDFSFRDLPKDAQPRNMEEAQRATAVAEAGKPGPAIVDVTMHMQEGEQYFVNRITFLGNSTTHDNVIRREMQLVESGVFNTEALKQSVKHLNQLGYFKALEGNENVQVDKTPGEKNKVDIALKLEEQNRNQLTFGAGVSQFEGAFAQFSFQTSNFLGKGETLSMSVLAGKRYKDYQLSFSEPYLFDRPITGGINVFNRTINYIGAFTQESTGGNVMTGFRAGQLHARLHVVQLRAGRDQQPEPGLHGSRARQHATRSWPTRCSSARTASGPSARSRRASCTTRSTTRSSRPPGGASRSASTSPASAATPASTSRASRPSSTSSRRASCRPASGPSSSSSPRGATACSCRSSSGWSRAASTRSAATTSAPSARATTSRGWSSAATRACCSTASTSTRSPGRCACWPSSTPGRSARHGQKFRSDAFVASTGAEVRFFMPVLNVPFRLIFARNINYEDILDNNYQPEKKWRFRFAVGSTF